MLLHIDDDFLIIVSAYGNKHTFSDIPDYNGRLFYFQKGEYLHLETLNNGQNCMLRFIDFLCEKKKLIGQNLI